MNCHSDMGLVLHSISLGVAKAYENIKFQPSFEPSSFPLTEEAVGDDTAFELMGENAALAFYDADAHSSTMLVVNWMNGEILEVCRDNFLSLISTDVMHRK